MTLRKRILLFLIPLLALLAGVGIAGVILIQRLGSRADVILREHYSTLAMAQLNEALGRIDTSFQLSLAGYDQTARAQYQHSWLSYRENLPLRQDSTSVPGQKDLVAQLAELTDRYRRQGDAFYARTDGAIGRQKEYFGSPGLLATFAELKAVSNKVLRLKQDQMEAASRATKRTATGSLIGCAVGLPIVLLVAACFALGALRAVVGAIQAVTRSAQSICDGNRDQGMPVRSHDELGQLAATFNQTIEHLRAADAELQLRTRLAAVESELGQRALTTEPTSSLLDGAVSRVAQALAVEYSKVLELLPGAEVFILRSGVGWKEGVIGHATVSSGPGSLPGYTLRSDAPVIVEDLQKENRFRGPALHYEHGIVSGVSAKITTHQGAYGVLGVHTKHRRSFDPEEIRFLQTVANLLGLAIDRRRAEEALAGSNRAYRALSRCNHALLQATDEAAWLQIVSRLIVDEAGYRMCWVGIAAQDSAKSIYPAAHAGHDDGYLAPAKLTWGDDEGGRSPTGICIRTGQLQVVRNLAAEMATTPWLTEARKRNYAACIAIPLTVDQTLFGALTIFSAKPYAFDSAEQGLLKEMADDLAFGIAMLRMRTRREQAEAELDTLNSMTKQPSLAAALGSLCLVQTEATS